MKDSFYPDGLAEIQRVFNENRDTAPDCVGHVSWDYKVGIFSRKTFQHLLNFGRCIGLHIEVYRTSHGIFHDAGYVKIVGKWEDIQRFLLKLKLLIISTNA